MCRVYVIHKLQKEKCKIRWQLHRPRKIHALEDLENQQIKLQMKCYLSWEKIWNTKKPAYLATLLWWYAAGEYALTCGFFRGFAGTPTFFRLLSPERLPGPQSEKAREVPWKDAGRGRARVTSKVCADDSWVQRSAPPQSLLSPAVVHLQQLWPPAVIRGVGS